MILFLITTFLVQQCQCVNPSSILFQEIFQYHESTRFKADFAAEVVDKIYNSFKQWFFTVVFCEFTYFENRILKYTENYGYGYPVLLLNSCPSLNNTKIKPKINTHGKTAYVVSSDNLSAENNELVIDALVRTGVFKPRSTIIFVINIPVTVDSYVYFMMKRHFQLLWSRRISNSVLILWSEQLKMYSFNPFINVISEIAHVKDISKLLERQYNNLYGYELRLSVFKTLYISSDTGPVDCNSRIVTTVMKHLNASCKALAPRDGNTVGDLLDNGTATGVTADLMDGYTDIELNSRILKTSYYGYIDTTYPLTQDELCFVIKKSEKQSTFTTIINLISINILILFSANVVLLMLTALLVRKIEIRIFNFLESKTLTHTIVDLIKLFIRQTVDIKFKGPIFRSLVLLIILYSLVVDCAIDGIIISAIAYPRFKSDMNTLKELTKTNLTFAIHARHISIYENSLDYEYEKIKDRIEIVNDKKIKEIIDEKLYRYATLLKLSEANYISRRPENMRDGRPLFHTVRECPQDCSIVYGLRYGSPYLNKIVKILHHLFQGGVLQFWKKTELVVENKETINASKDRKPLNVDNLKEIYYVYLLGVFMSTIALIVEKMDSIFKKGRDN